VQTVKRHRVATQYLVTMKPPQSGEPSSPNNAENLVNLLHSRERPTRRNLVNPVHPTGEPGSPQPSITKERKKDSIPPICPPKPKTRKPLNDEPPGFHEFYCAFPRKDAPRGAAKAFKAAINRGATVEEIMAGLATYKFSDDPDWLPLPATWLNQDRWLHQPSKPKPRKPTVDERIRATFGLFDDEDQFPAQTKGLLQ